MSESDRELVFVVDVSSMAEGGFRGSTEYRKSVVDIVFDEGHDGLRLTGEMAKRLAVRKGSKVVVVVETDRSSAHEMMVSGTGKEVRLSDEAVYRAVASEGGAVLRIRKT